MSDTTEKRDRKPETEQATEQATEQVTLNAVAQSKPGRSLDPQLHDGEAARTIASDLCTAMTDAYARLDDVRPETLAIAAQTVLETLLAGFEREGVDTVTMRIALANSILANGGAEVSIDVTEIDARESATLEMRNATIH